MKILQVSSAQSFGGGERYVVDLTTALLARGHEVHVVVRPGSPLPAKIHALAQHNVSVLPLRNALDVWSANALARIVRQQGSEIIHAHMARDYPLAAYAARRNLESRLIVTRHVLFKLNQLHGRVLARASKIIAVSQAVARELNDQQLLPASRISVVPNGVDVRRLREARLGVERVDLRRTWDLPNGCVVIGSVGQITPLKGHDVFIKAAAQVVTKFPLARFFIAGEDSSPGAKSLAALNSLIAELGLQDKCHLIGRIDDVGYFLAGLDLFVSASRTESFGLAIAEAMAGGIAVIATATDGARELIQDGKTGRIVSIDQPEELAKTIVSLLSDPEQRDAMGQLAHSYALQNFSLEQMVNAVEKIYQDSLDA